ncbi:MAG: TRAP transporter small permease, partial [Nitrospira sp.]|nr:TRAP transporter small permease [Nitrospira sp.]
MLHRIENLLSVVILLTLAVLPILEILVRKFFLAGIPGSTVFVQHFTLWIGFLGAAIATREEKLLALTAGPSLLNGLVKATVQIFAGAVGCAVSVLLCIASVNLVQAEVGSGAQLVLGIPIWVAQTVMPIGFALIAIRLGLHASKTWFGRTIVFALAAGIVLLGHFESLPGSGILIPGILVLLAAIALGTPIFVGLGGMAILLFWNASTPIASVPAETYRLVVSPTLPTIPLFTLAGYILAESQASHRLVRVFRAFFGWMPGGV